MFHAAGKRRLTSIEQRDSALAPYRHSGVLSSSWIKPVKLRLIMVLLQDKDDAALWTRRVWTTMAKKQLHIQNDNIP